MVRMKMGSRLMPANVQEESNRARLMRPLQWALITACILLIAHAALLVGLANKPPGPLLSCLVQLIFGVMCAVASIQASRRSGSLGRYFWRLMTVTFTVW